VSETPLSVSILSGRADADRLDALGEARGAGLGERAAAGLGEARVDGAAGDRERLREDELRAVADRDLRAAVAEVDVHRGDVLVLGAAVDVVEGVDERGDLAVHADDLELRAARELDVAHDVVAAHREGDVLDLRGSVAGGLADLAGADDERVRVAAEADGDLQADDALGALGVARGDADVLHEHVLGERREHQAAAAEVVLAEDLGHLAGEELEALLDGPRAKVVAERQERGGRDRRKVAHRRLHQLDAGAAEISEDRGVVRAEHAEGHLENLLRGTTVTAHAETVGHRQEKWVR